MTEIQTLIHKTIPRFLSSILERESLFSPIKRGEKPAKWYDSSYVYLTPQNNTNTIKENKSVYFHFDAKSMMRDYDKFFINNGNSFGPLDGKGNPSNCGCKWTYNTITPIDAPCAKKTLDEIESVLQYDMTKCDGGPEIGFPEEVKLLPYLRKITISSKDFETIKGTIPEKFLPYFEVFSTGGRKTLKKIATRRRRSYRRRRQF
jgi:hypothetical protein